MPMLLSSVVIFRTDTKIDVKPLLWRLLMYVEQHVTWMSGWHFCTVPLALLACEASQSRQMRSRVGTSPTSLKSDWLN